jgi:small-conductance mechanosensitive channel
MFDRELFEEAAGCLGSCGMRIAIIIAVGAASLAAWKTDGYWQAILIELLFGLCLFYILEVLMVGEVFSFWVATAALVAGWFVTHYFWNMVLIEVSATYFLFIIARHMEIRRYQEERDYIRENWTQRQYDFAYLDQSEYDRRYSRFEDSESNQ